jgi:hypothetical protein
MGTLVRASISAAAAVALAFALGAGSANAQTTRGNKAKPAKADAGGGRVKTYDFTGDEIDGDLVKPDGEFVDTRKFATHTSLIRIRKDFIREIVKSAEDL